MKHNNNTCLTAFSKTTRVPACHHSGYYWS